MGNTRGFTREFTLDEIQKAVVLRDRKMDWHLVAREIGPDVVISSLKTTVSLYLNKKWQPTRLRTRGLRADLEYAVETLGITDVKILCEFFGIREDSMRYNLHSIGLDKEMRDEIRRDFDLRALREGMARRKAQ